MDFSIMFKVTARCNIFDLNNQDAEPDKKDIVLTLNRSLAENFIYRCGQKNFSIGKDFKVTIGDDNSIEINTTDNKHIIVLNTSQLFEQILDGYNRINMMKLLDSLLEFDFESAIAQQNIQFVEDEI